MKKLSFFQLLVITARVIGAIIVGFCCNGAVLANTGADNTNLAKPSFNWHEGNGEMRLVASQLPLGQILKHLADQSKVPIHYSALAKDLVTISCNGADLQKILSCLSARKADLAFRYQALKANLGHTAQPLAKLAEVWVIGSQSANVPAGIQLSEEVKDINNLADQISLQNENTRQDQTEKLLELAKSDDPERRAEAIGALLANGQAGDLAVKAVLEQALADEDDLVRAQAVSSLAHHEGDMRPVIQEALNDRSADVRLMAVDAITDDIPLLQQAMNDEDESVRNLASQKYQELASLMK